MICFPKKSYLRDFCDIWSKGTPLENNQRTYISEFLNFFSGEDAWIESFHQYLEQNKEVFIEEEKLFEKVYEGIYIHFEGKYKFDLLDHFLSFPVGSYMFQFSLDLSKGTPLEFNQRRYIYEFVNFFGKEELMEEFHQYLKRGYDTHVMYKRIKELEGELDSVKGTS